MPDYYGKIGEVRGKQRILSLVRVWPDERQEFWDGEKWIDVPGDPDDFVDSDDLNFVNRESDEEWDLVDIDLSNDLIQQLAEPWLIAELEHKAKAEADRDAAALREAKDREIRFYGRPLQPGEWPPGWINNGTSQAAAQEVQ